MTDITDLGHDTNANGGAALDPREAARLLEQTSLKAQRQFAMVAGISLFVGVVGHAIATAWQRLATARV
jgi:hypothetical protein